MTTITADDGTKYELKPTSHGFILKPLQPTEKKHTHFLQFFNEDAPAADYILKLDLDLTESQAPALADAVKALVEYVQDPADDSGGEALRTGSACYAAANKARSALQEQN